MWVIFSALLFAVCALSAFQWRFTLTGVLLIGFTQDVFRKLVVGEPRIFVVMVGVVFAIGLLSLLSRKGSVGLTEPFLKWTSDLRLPLTLFIVLLAVQFFHSLFRFGSPVLGIIGLLSYGAPFLAVVLGYYWANNLHQVRQFFKVYVSIGIFVALSVALSFQGYEWGIFKEVGAGLKIYDMGTVLMSHAGIMRTGEIAAWHIATTACLLLVLFFTERRNRSTLLLAVFITLLMIAIFLTGRRKMFMLFSLFFVFYIFGSAYFRRGLAIGYVIAGGGIMLVGWLVVEVIFPGGYGESVNNYIARGTTVYSAATDRFVHLGINPIFWAYNRVGLFGGGLGVGSQGAGYYSSIAIAGGSSEGGLGKIMVELGLLGLIIMAWLGLNGLRYVYRILKLAAMQRDEPRWLAFVLGLTVFLFVNVLTFSVATQLYGDMFILIMLGIIAGFLLGVPRMIVISQQRAY